MPVLYLSSGKQLDGNETLPTLLLNKNESSGTNFSDALPSRTMEKRTWAFSNMVSVVRQHLMSYISAKSFFENPEKAWQELIEEQKARIKEKESNDQNVLFPEWAGLTFEKSRKTGLKVPEIRNKN